MKKTFIVIKYSFQRISGLLKPYVENEYSIVQLNCTHDCRFINTSIKPFFT